ncbi:hypothetical protein [Microvirga zambiensis]|uniref:hypothetical protein n=1 Tax=Microvirga zambiensis TaxID=1402137 RepID=UPI00191D263F|nr:hypothetical protein [Microvirga zambiensis]
MEAELEFVARALHDTEDDAQTWDCEPDIIRDEFRLYAHAALELLAEHRQHNTSETKFLAFPYAA